MKYLPPTFATKNIVIKTSSEEKMNRLLFGMMLLAVGCLAGSCTDDDEYTQGVWMRRSDLDGVARGQASSFTIDNKGYLCCGFRGTNKTYLKDLWVYDINNDYWTQCADMPDEAQGRHSATAFALNGKGYITTGVQKMSLRIWRILGSMIPIQTAGHGKMTLAEVRAMVRWLFLSVDMAMWVRGIMTTT